MFVTFSSTPGVRPMLAMKNSKQMWRPPKTDLGKHVKDVEGNKVKVLKPPNMLNTYCLDML